MLELKLNKQTTIEEFKSFQVDVIKSNKILMIYQSYWPESVLNTLLFRNILNDNNLNDDVENKINMLPLDIHTGGIKKYINKLLEEYPIGNITIIMPSCLRYILKSLDTERIILIELDNNNHQEINDILMKYSESMNATNKLLQNTFRIYNEQPILRLLIASHLHRYKYINRDIFEYQLHTIFDLYSQYESSIISDEEYDNSMILGLPYFINRLELCLSEMAQLVFSEDGDGLFFHTRKYYSSTEEERISHNEKINIIVLPEDELPFDTHICLPYLLMRIKEIFNIDDSTTGVFKVVFGSKYFMSNTYYDVTPNEFNLTDLHTDTIREHTLED